MREYQVRICERLRVKFPGPTRQSRHFGRPPTTSGPALETDIVIAGQYVSEWDGPAVLPPRTAQKMSGA